MSDPAEPADEPSPLSLERLRSAFARMLGEDEGAADDRPVVTVAPDPEAVTPDGIVEAMLFVGRADGTVLTAEAMAAAIRDVSPNEVDQIVERLNATYLRGQSALRVESTEAGHRIVLAEGLDRMADQLQGKVRSTKLTSAALETLAVIAYRQPIDAEAVEALRGERSGPTLNLLVRRGLLRCDPEEPGGKPKYATTDRFLRTLGLAGVEQLPRVEELDD